MRTRLAVGSVIATLATVAIANWLHGEPPPTPEQQKIYDLVDQLGNDKYEVREQATEALRKLPESQIPTLNKAIRRGSDAEARWRGEQVARSIMASASRSQSSDMQLALVPPGEFEMGSPEGEDTRRPDELRHRVRITKSFLIGTREVTQREYRAVMGENPSFFTPVGGGKALVVGNYKDTMPVEQVSWFEALDFCNRLSKADGFPAYYKFADEEREEGRIKKANITILGGNGYRLPTEAEWEFACRAGTKSLWHFGDACNGSQANVKSMSAGGYGGPTLVHLRRTRPVGEYHSNDFGLFDMHGNAGEWCWDVYEKDYYKDSPADDPTGPAEGTHRVIRGGSWMLSDTSARSASRHFLTPDDRKEYTGFRVARTPLH